MGPHKDREKLWPGWELVRVFLCPCVLSLSLCGPIGPCLKYKCYTANVCINVTFPCTTTFKLFSILSLAETICLKIPTHTFHPLYTTKEKMTTHHNILSSWVKLSYLLYNSWLSKSTRSNTSGHRNRKSNPRLKYNPFRTDTHKLAFCHELHKRHSCHNWWYHMGLKDVRKPLSSNVWNNVLIIENQIKLQESVQRKRDKRGGFRQLHGFKLTMFRARMSKQG